MRQGIASATCAHARTQVRILSAFSLIPLLVSGRSFGIAGLVALFFGPVLYIAFRAIYGGPATPSGEVGNEEPAFAEAEAAEGAA